MVLIDESGRVLSKHVIGAEDWHQWNQEDGLVLTLPLEEARHCAGRYHLSIEVVTPAKGMAGKAHCIVAELGLTNVEGIPFTFVGIPVGVIALLLGILILVMRPRLEKNSQATVDSTSDVA